MRFSRFGIHAIVTALVGAATICSLAWAQQQARPGRKQGGGGQGDARRQQGNGRVFPAPKSANPYADLILGCPTHQGITLRINPKQDFQGTLTYGGTGGKNPSRREFPSWATDIKCKAGEPQDFQIKGDPGSDLSYSLSVTHDGKATQSIADRVRVPLPPAKGNSFTFFVQGDSHPERNPKMCVPELYERTLNLAASQKPDFFICLGDDFSVDTLRERTKTTVEGVYKQQVPYLGLVGKVAPLFLVNGNHEQAAKANLNGTPDSVAVWAQNARNRYFPQPAPDAFYSGNSEKVENIGLLRNYFAFSWGHALIAVIDPYWHSAVTVDNGLEGKERNRDLWKVTLGDAQYKWLKNSLENSKAKYKFVFAHHVHGTGRGGVEQAPYYEWGGKDRNGADRFKEYRPNWEMPIHELFKKTGVQVFFQGHDHIFCKQELEGVIYQSCPTPGDASNPLYNADAYRSGEKVSGAGLVKVTVSPENAKIEFLRAYLPGQEVDGKKHGEVAHSYTIKPRGVLN